MSKRVHGREVLPAGWAIVSVAQAGKVRLGRQRSPDRSSGSHPTKYLRAANITARGLLDLSDVLVMDFRPEERERFGLRAGDLVLAEGSGSSMQVGRAAVWRDEIPGCCFQNTVIRFRPHLVLSDYALIVFRHLAVSGVFARAARGVGIQHLGANRFAGLSLPLAPLREQGRIAREAARRLAELRETESSLRSALSRLHNQVGLILETAVRGQLVEQEVSIAPRERRPVPDHLPAVRSVAGSHEQPSLFPPGQRATTLPDDPLPVGWAWAAIAEVGDVKLGKQLSPGSRRGSRQRKYLRVANVLEDFINIGDVKRMHFTATEEKTLRLQSGDILLNEGQSPDLVGRPALFRDEVPKACFQNTLIRFRAGPLVDPEYALLVFRHYLRSGVFREAAKWSTNIAHLGIQRFAGLPFPLPPLAEQRRVATEAKKRLQASASQLGAVNDSLVRLPAMERELLTTAVRGELVPQDPTDEPADALILRLGPPPDDSLSVQDSESPSWGGSRMKEAQRTREPRGPGRDLADVIRRAGNSVTLPQLYALAGYDRDSTEDVERFYLALREQLGQSVEIAPSSAAENATLEPMKDAS